MCFYKINIDSDLSNTSCRRIKNTTDAIYIEYNDGFKGVDWFELSEKEIKLAVPEWFDTPNEPLTLTEECQIDILLNTEYIVCLLESQLM